jgi:hypothetical protein
MTPEQELEVLNEVYVADSPYDTQLNIAKRIKELLDKTDSLTNNFSLRLCYPFVTKCTKEGNCIYEAVCVNGSHGNADAPYEARCVKCKQTPPPFNE